mmetsp:Transcript_34660/g.33847  ORF Transcript_34660/g.33847 Transcript_34660/m.33847 type:complete len:171 (-) Transcript_34660:40-552(-)
MFDILIVSFLFIMKFHQVKVRFLLKQVQDFAILLKLLLNQVLDPQCELLLFFEFALSLFNFGDVTFQSFLEDLLDGFLEKVGVLIILLRLLNKLLLNCFFFHIDEVFHLLHVVLHFHKLALDFFDYRFNDVLRHIFKILNAMPSMLWHAFKADKLLILEAEEHQVLFVMD